MSKTEVVRFRVTPEQKQKIEEKARHCDMSVSEFLIKLTELATTRPVIGYEPVLKSE